MEGNTIEDWRKPRQREENGATPADSAGLDALRKKKSEEAGECETWPVTFDKDGNVRGLPEGKSRSDVVLSQGSDGKWYAQDLSPETLEEIRLWRADWQDAKKDF
ncbi:MAG: hypothetical protein ACYC48_01875 [Minisyncoccota bacterium]